MMTGLLKILTKNKGIIICITGAVILFTLTAWSYRSGYNSCKYEFDNYILNQEREILKLQQEYLTREKEYQLKTQELTSLVHKRELEYVEAVSNLGSEYSERLRMSEQRADSYKSMSESAGNSCRNLANHTAGLDKSLEEGRSLVKQLRALIGLRDDQLLQCGKQLRLIAKPGE